MKNPIAYRAASGFRPGALMLATLSLSALALAGCKTTEEPGAHLAGHTLIDPAQRNPIMVSQQPASTSVRIARGSMGLSPGQKDQIAAFLGRYRATDAGNSKLVIAVPSGTPNETSAMYAVGEMRRMIAEHGFADSTVVVQPYGDRDANAAVRLSYLRYVAEGPQCGRWPTNLAREERNLNYQNFGCAQQHNLAAMIANPADLVAPRTMDPADQERRSVVFDRYRQGKPTASDRNPDESASTKGSN